GDGKPDLAVGAGGRVVILLGAGAGTFGARGKFGVGGSPLDIVVGDFNGDGKPDLAAAIVFATGSIFSGSFEIRSNKVSVLLNTSP
ncbi:MAG TPA: VCBS repeat-containing protein, partial [Candidatus Binatia bacterium]|nr:VCBS repeat-containing protein [Candidatus Binatia bacterium]